MNAATGFFTFARFYTISSRILLTAAVFAGTVIVLAGCVELTQRRRSPPATREFQRGDVCHTARAKRLTPAAVNQLIAGRGKQAVWDLFADDKDWEYVMARIAGGKQEWLDIAARLYEGSDAAAGEDLTNAVGDAVDRAPERVLRMKRSLFEPENICVVAPRDTDRAELEAYKRRLRSLQSVTRPDLIEKRDAAIQILREWIAELEKKW